MAAKKKVKKAARAKGGQPKAAVAGAPMPHTVALATSMPTPVILHANLGDTLTLTTTVKNVVTPYAVSYDRIVRLVGVVSDSDDVTVGVKGGHTIGWAFNERTAAGWEHLLTAKVSGKPPVVLMKGSAAAGDDGFASGFAFVVVS